MGNTFIQFDNVSKAFGANQVLNGVTLDIPSGSITTIIGKSGMGKSVLLKHVIGLMHPDSGKVLFEGKPLSRMRRKERKAFKRKISYMFQGMALFDSMTVFENIALPLMERTSMGEKEITDRVHEKMNQLDLFNVDNKYPSQISGGMKKRVALARALVTEPEVILFDEPTTGLDPIRKHAVHSMIADYQKQFGFTGIVVSHEIPDVFYISQQIIMLDEGVIVYKGSAEQILMATNPVVMDFIMGQDRRHDTLTGMAPQSHGEERFKEEMARLVRYNIPFSIILLTIENMGEINARMGHMAAQTVLRDFAKQVQNHLRIIDSCSRCDLNRLMIILSCSNLEEARITCARLSNELSRDEIVEIQPYPDFCFKVAAGFVELKKNDRLENILADAGSWQNMRYDFRVC